MYTAARFIIYFCVSPCDESGLKQVQRNPSPLPVVRRACYTQGCRTRVVHHVRTTVERDARTRRKQRHVVVTKATLIYERCSVSRVDGLAITRNEGQFVSRLARTVVVSFSLLPPPSPLLRLLLSLSKYERNSAISIILLIFHTRGWKEPIGCYYILHTYATEQCNWRNRVSGGK